MADFALSRLGPSLPVTIACLGLLYCKIARGVGQDVGKAKLNLTDLALLPMTPILGSGRAPLQPLEVSDAAKRLALLALTDPALRPPQLVFPQDASSSPKQQLWGEMQRQSASLRIFDAVGPETMTFLQVLEKFALYQKNKRFWPVFVDYRNLEHILNIKSLGNLNRQFVSLLRSEQDGLSQTDIGNPAVFDSLIPDEPLLTLDQALAPAVKRRFPYLKTLRWALDNPRVIPLGARLGLEIVESALLRRRPPPAAL